VGSDLDLVAIVQRAPEPCARRAIAWDLAELPVAAELLVCSRQEWQRMLSAGGRFARTLEPETVWVYPAAHERRCPPDLRPDEER
jgi:hypothetical protein